MMIMMMMMTMTMMMMMMMMMLMLMMMMMMLMMVLMKVTAPGGSTGAESHRSWRQHCVGGWKANFQRRICPIGVCVLGVGVAVVLGLALVSWGSRHFARSGFAALGLALVLWGLRRFARSGSVALAFGNA